jgi:Helix-turn-helix domain
VKPKQSSLEYVQLAWLVNVRAKNQKPCLATKLLLVFLASRANGSGNSWYGYAAISKQTGLSIATINRATKHLKELGVLTWDKGFKNQYEKKTNYYYLNLERMRELAELQEKQANAQGEQSADDQPPLIISDVPSQGEPVDAQVEGVTTQDEQRLPLIVSSGASHHDNQTDQRTDQKRTDQYKTDQNRTDPEKIVKVFCNENKNVSTDEPQLWEGVERSSGCPDGIPAVDNNVNANVGGHSDVPAKAGAIVATVNYLGNMPEMGHELMAERRCWPEAVISRAHVAAPTNVSNAPAQNAEGILAASQAHVAAATSDASGPNHAQGADSSYEPDLYRTITTKFGIRFDGHRGEWQHTETGWEVDSKQLERMFYSIGVERKQAWDAWARTEGKELFTSRVLENAGLTGNS